VIFTSFPHAPDYGEAHTGIEILNVLSAGLRFPVVPNADGVIHGIDIA